MVDGTSCTLIEELFDAVNNNIPERIKMESKVIAVDFDGTLCTNNYPKIGIANNTLIEELIESRKNGHKLILWTCREDSLLVEAVMFCAQHGLYFDEVNNNIPERIEMYGTNPRKIGADLYIDDLAVIPDSFLCANNYPIKIGVDLSRGDDFCTVDGLYFNEKKY